MPAVLQTETDIIKAVYAAINRNDIDAVLAYLDPQIVRIEPDGFPTAGVYRGHAELKKHLSQGRQTWAEGSCEPERFTVFGNKILAFVHVHVRLKNKSEWIDARFPDGFTFKNGKVGEMHTFVTTEDAMKWAGQIK